MDAEFKCTIGGDSITFTDKISYEIRSDYTNSISSFSFVVYREDAAKLRKDYPPLLPVTLYVDGRQQIIGRIDRVTSTGNGSALNISGRSYLAEMALANADPRTKFKKEDTLEQAMLKVLSVFGISKVEGYAATRNLLSGKSGKDKANQFKTAKLEDFKINPGQGAFEICNRIAARYGATIQPGINRNTIVLAEPNYEQAPLYELKRTPTGNIINARADRDWSSVPSIVTAVGKQNTRIGSASIVKNLEVSIPAIGENSPNKLHLVPEVQRILKKVTVESPELWDLPEYPPATHFGTDSSYFMFRPVYFEDKDSRNLEQLNRAVKRIIADKVQKTLTYSCTLLGNKDPKTGYTYAIDTMAHVVDEIEDINEVMWVKSMVLAHDDRGTVTTLELIRPYCWVL